jgi:flagellar protein FliS
MNDPRAAYIGQMVTTASPARLLVLLYDRLQLDVQRAIEAQKVADHVEASKHLLHAQEIVLELNSSLRHDVWDGAHRLAALYAWLHTELVNANVKRSQELSEGCLEVLKPLADAWREAAIAPRAAAG